MERLKGWIVILVIVACAGVAMSSRNILLLTCEDNHLHMVLYSSVTIHDITQIQYTVQPVELWEGHRRMINCHSSNCRLSQDGHRVDLNFHYRAGYEDYAYAVNYIKYYTVPGSWYHHPYTVSCRKPVTARPTERPTIAPLVRHTLPTTHRTTRRTTTTTTPMMTTRTQFKTSVCPTFPTNCPAGCAKFDDNWCALCDLRLCRAAVFGKK